MLDFIKLIQLAEKVEVSKPPVTTTEKDKEKEKEKEKEQTKLLSARSEKQIEQPSQPSMTQSRIRKMSIDQVIQQAVQQAKATPSILELKTPEQKKVS